jgi:hypothetical protein
MGGHNQVMLVFSVGFFDEFLKHLGVKMMEINVHLNVQPQMF